MPKLSGGEALVKSLVREGVEVIFGLPGVQMYGIIAAIRDEPGIRMITTRHEQATTYMADGYSRVTGKPGVALVVPGEGLYNAGSGLATAYARSSPVLVIAGQIPRSQIGKDLGGLHEVADQMDVIRPVTKWRRQVLTPHEVPGCVTEAFSQMRNGRPRPVEIEMPPETMVEREEVELEEPAPLVREVPDDRPVEGSGKGYRRSTNSGHLRRWGRGQIERRGRARTVFRGGEHSGHHVGRRQRDNFRPPSALVRLFVGTARRVVRGHGVRRRHHRHRHPLCASQPVRGIGQARTYKFGRHGVRQDSHEHARPARRRAGDHRGADSDIEKAGAGDRPSPAEAVAEARRRIATDPLERNEPQHSVLQALQAGIPEEAYVVWGMTQLGYYSRGHYQVFEPKAYVDSGYAGNLGYSFPTSLGVKTGAPDRPVVCVVGDGGFMYNSSELSTAVKYGINTVTVIFNDGAYGNVARDLDEDFGGQYEADFVNPDFVKFAESFGATGMRTREPADLAHVIPEALERGGPVLIDVPVERMPRPGVWTKRAAWTTPQEGLIDA